MHARQRGVKIQAIVPAKLDNFAVRMASRSRSGPLLKAGIEIFEYQPTRLHSKIMIVDGCLVTAGSVDFDERSFRINGEANMNVLDRDVAGRLTRLFEEDKAKSRRVTLEDFKKRNWIGKGFDLLVGLFRSQL